MNSPLLDRLKASLLQRPRLNRAWASRRSRQQLRSYERRRETYAAQATEQGLEYSWSDSMQRVQSSLAARGRAPTPRTVGEVHTYLWLPKMSWHEALVPDLEKLGPVSRFDYATLGIRRSQLTATNSDSPSLRAKAGRASFEHIQRVHEIAPVDWLFVYANGREIEASWVRKVADELGIPTVNMCLDDKHSWEGELIGQQRSGQIDLASVFDLSWTSSRVATSWYLVEGGTPIYMPEGFDASRYYPEDATKDIDVSFLGASYGFRPSTVADLERKGIRIEAHGAGWPRGPVGDDGARGLFNRSLINMGMGGVGYDPAFTTLKGRDFDVPGTGGGMYLTTYNPELAACYDVTKEIACYATFGELVELVRHYLANPEEALLMGLAARERALAEHRWLHRYQALLEMLGVLRTDSQ